MQRLSEHLNWPLRHVLTAGFWQSISSSPELQSYRLNGRNEENYWIWAWFIQQESKLWRPHHSPKPNSWLSDLIKAISLHPGCQTRTESIWKWEQIHKVKCYLKMRCMLYSELMKPTAIISGPISPWMNDINLKICYLPWFHYTNTLCLCIRHPCTETVSLDTVHASCLLTALGLGSNLKYSTEEMMNIRKFGLYPVHQHLSIYELGTGLSGDWRSGQIILSNAKWKSSKWLKMELDQLALTETDMPSPLFGGKCIWADHKLQWNFRVLPQFCSSERSTQSNIWLHINVESMHISSEWHRKSVSFGHFAQLGRIKNEQAIKINKNLWLDMIAFTTLR